MTSTRNAVGRVVGDQGVNPADNVDLDGMDAYLIEDDNVDAVGDSLSLGELVERIELFQVQIRLSDDKLKHLLIDRALQETLALSLDVLKGYTGSDSTYTQFMRKIIPEFVFLDKQNSVEDDATFAALASAFTVVLWMLIEDKVTSDNLCPQTLLGNIDMKYNFYCLQEHVTQHSPFIRAVVKDWAVCGKNATMMVNGAYFVFDNLSTLTKQSDGSVSMEVQALVQDIMNVYDTIYAPCFESPPLGVLTSEGVLTLNDSGVPVIEQSGVKFMKNLYKAIAEKSKNYLPKTTRLCTIDDSFLNADGSLKETYSPLYQLNNLHGVSDSAGRVRFWLEFRPKLELDVTRKVTSVLAQIKEEDSIRVQVALKELFTNCIIVVDFNRVVDLSMVAKIGNKVVDIGAVVSKEAVSIFAADTGELHDSSWDTFSVQRLLFLFDSAAYNNKILFAFKYFDKRSAAGLRVSEESVVLGCSASGAVVTENFNSPTAVVTAITATSQSGKGVLTLNILVNLIASGCPVLYLDHKPDMAATLWELERTLAGKGEKAKVFAVDSHAGVGAQTGRPVRTFINASPTPRFITDPERRLFVYLKTLQFIVLIGHLRLKQLIPVTKKVFFVLDEAQAFNVMYVAFIKHIMGKKSKDLDEEEKEYYNRVVEVFARDLQAGITTTRTTAAGSGRMGFIVIGQQNDIAAWKDPISSDKTGLFGGLLTNVTLKLLGPNGGTSDTYGLPADISKAEGAGLSGQKGVFFRSGAAKTPPGGKGLKAIRTFLVLNKNDFNLEEFENKTLPADSYTAKLLSNISGDAAKHKVIHEDLLNTNKTVRESVGFYGLLKELLGSDKAVAEKVSLGYNLMDDVFKLLGLSKRYSCVEEYLEDSNLDSLYTIADLLKLCRGTQKDGTVGDNKQADNTPGASGPVTSTACSKVWFNHNSGKPNPGGGVPADNKEPIVRSKTVGGSSGQGPVTLPGSSTVNERVLSKKAYTAPLKFVSNPFTTIGVSNNPIASITALRVTSGVLLDDISRAFGGLDRVSSIGISNSGLMVINDVMYKPTFDEQVVASMPVDIQDAVSEGYVAELFNFKDLVRFRNLSTLGVDNARLAESRMRRELGIHPRRPWSVLFTRLRSLQEFHIAGTVITNVESAAVYDKGGRGGYTLTERLREKLRVPVSVLTSSRMDWVWQSRPVRVLTGALGFTVGLQVVSLAVSLLGPWGLVFGAFAAVGAARELKKAVGTPPVGDARELKKAVGTPPVGKTKK